MSEFSRGGVGAGVAFALVSSASFGLSGPLARGLQEAGWSAGAAVTARIAFGALVLLVPGIVAMRSRWALLRQPRVLGLLAMYGVVAIVLPQLCYFYAISTLQVGVALLIEFAAPVVVVLWMWLVHGQRPTGKTFLGAAVAGAGLVMVLQIFGGVSLDAAGVAWSIGSMIGAAGYFIMSGHSDAALPGIAMAAGGLLVAAVCLGLAGLVGVLPMRANVDDVVLAGSTVPWWLPVALLGVVSAAVSYAAGIAALRRLGPRLGSFIALTEVLAAIIFAWLLLDEVPDRIQLIGGALIVAGVIVVRLGESSTRIVEDEPVIP